MSEFTHQRHKPPAPLKQRRELIVAVPPMQSNVNLSRIVRAAGCFGIERIVVGGPARIDRKIARDAVDWVTVEAHRTLTPVLQRLRREGYRLVGLEQTTHAARIYDYQFERKSVLVVGHERDGITDDVLRILDGVIEIPVHGLPFSHNAATSATIAMYEYCRQFPEG